MSNQIGFSELLQSILGPERKILASEKEMFHFAMRIDELEELLEQDDIFALFWVNDHIKNRDRAEFLEGLEHDYIGAHGSYDETDSIEGIERYFLDGMQYVYCYLKELPANETTRIDAAEWFLSEQTESNLGQVLIAYSIGFLIEAMLEDLAGTGSGSTGRDGQTSMKAGRKAYGQRAREREIIERIIRKRRPRKGNLVVSYRQITQELNDEGYTTRMGKPWYPPRMVRLICERQKLADAAERETSLSHKSDIGPGDYLSDEEIRLCRAVVSDEERVIFELMLGSGLRPGEICQLQERDMRIEHGNAAIFVRYGKWTKRAKRTRERKKSHWVYISEQVRDMLARHMREKRSNAKRRDPVFVNCWGNRLTYRNLYDRMQKLGRRAGVKELKPHRMRHSYATNFLNSGGGIEHLQSQLGHEHLSTTQIYAKSLEKAIRPAIERLQKYHDQL